MTTEAPQSTSDMQALYDALTSAAGEDGRTRVGYDEALRSAGTIGQFSSNGELDDARVEAAARGLIEQGLLEAVDPLQSRRSAFLWGGGGDGYLKQLHEHLPKPPKPRTM